MKNIIILLSLMAMMLHVSCCGGNKKSVPEPDSPTFEAPKWSVTNSNAYECSMSAIVVLPSALLTYESDTDELAVFCGDECRGVAKRIKVDSKTSVWMLLIYGKGNDNELLYFKYYSSHNKFMYKDTSYITFEEDEKYGTVDNPFILSMQKITSTDK